MTRPQLNTIIPEEVQRKIPANVFNPSLRKSLTEVRLQVALTKKALLENNQGSQDIDQNLLRIRESEVRSIVVTDVIRSIVADMAKTYIGPNLQEDENVLSVYNTMTESLIKKYSKDKENKKSRKEDALDDVLSFWNTKNDGTITYRYWKDTIQYIVSKTISQYTKTINPQKLENFVSTVIGDFRENNKVAINTCTKELIVLKQEISEIAANNPDDKNDLINEKIKNFEVKRNYPDGQGRKESATATPDSAAV